MWSIYKEIIHIWTTVVDESVACVASVSVKQRAKKKRRTGVSAFYPRENGAFYFCSRPIFRAGETLKTRFFALFSTETLAMQANESEEWSSQLIPNFSNWKEEAWKNQGFNGIRTRNLRDAVAMLYELSYEASLPMCSFTAQWASHWYRRGHGFESRRSPEFFRLLLPNCLNWKLTAIIILHFQKLLF